ncbi:urate hydroxylase PuuD [Teredinibacter purpureus]|jgi:Predicted membrane protein|uniref:urate hydroxylase PuuD n=1 Tax=Teredinibacter purpureus TaxID=2731756 RepID=UPI0005F82257|nr:urate hydroxylase PuuD [Teredinibacter purpureus]
MEIVDFLFRWAHLLFGITWIGMLYYFNFIQTEYFKEADGSALPDVKAKLAPRALWWFRWGAMFTFVSGVILLGGVQHKTLMNDYIILGALLGTFMFLNVWLIIWPKQKIILGLAEGDAAASAPKAALASRTNTLFSGPMAFCMLASPHLGYSADYLVAANGASLGLWLSIALAVLLQVNAIVGKPGPIASVRGVIHMSLALTAVFFLLNLYL